MPDKPPIRLPIAVPFADREVAHAGTFNTDAELINCYVESYEDRKFVVKRPGLVAATTYGPAGVVNGQGIVAYNGAIYAMGSNILYRNAGAGNGSGDGTAWTASTTGTFPGRSNHGCIVFQGAMWVMGGKNTGGIALLNDVWSSPDGVNWTQVTSAAPWTKRSDFGLAVLGNTLYLMGGAGPLGVAFGDVWSTTDGVNWTQVVGTAPWAIRLAPTVVSFNQGIFLMGGNTPGTGYLNDVWFTPDGATWTQMVTTAAWTARAFHSSLVFGGKIWVAGGTDGTAKTDVWSSIDGITWTNTGNLPAARAQMASCVYTGKMWFITGADVTVTGTTTVWSTANGAAFTVSTATYGGAALIAPQAVVFQTPTSVSSINAPTMWLVAGDGPSFNSLIWRATLNVALPSSFSIGTSAAITTPFQFNTQNAGAYLIIKTTTDAWVLYAGLVQQITSTNYPKVTVPGVVNLDDTLYVMDATGTIYGSNLSDPFTWSALNFITADYQADVGIALHKYQNYVVAFKSTSMQFFYDAGRYPGSPLLPQINANARVGCPYAASIVSMGNTLVFVAVTNTFGRYVAVLNGFNAERISTPDIERVLGSLNASDTLHAFSIRINGHDFYVLSSELANITMVYDFKEKLWCRWASGSTGQFFLVVSSYATDGTIDYLQDYAAGAIYTVSPTVYQDGNGILPAGPIFVQATGDLFDGGTNTRKFCSSLTVIGDRLSAGGANNATISWSDDDGQTYNTGFVVDLTKARPRIPRLGSFRRRRHRLTHTALQPLRVEAFELEITG